MVTEGWCAKVKFLRFLLIYSPFWCPVRRLVAEEGTYSKKTWLQKILFCSGELLKGPDFGVRDGHG